MDKALKPDRFSTLANTPNASTEWKHWYYNFTNFLDAVSSSKSSKVNPLHCLSNCISSTVFAYIADCSDYDAAITILRDLYEKKKNPIFARFTLYSRKQKESESIDDYYVALQQLARDCSYTNVTADTYRQEAIRDAFVSGITSTSIRQRLFENTQSDLSEVITLSRILETAQRDATAYPNQLREPTSAATSQFSPSHEDNINLSAAAVKHQKCFYCGYQSHDRRRCPARDATCKKCGKIGHYEKVQCAT